MEKHVMHYKKYYHRALTACIIFACGFLITGGILLIHEAGGPGIAPSCTINSDTASARKALISYKQNTGVNTTGVLSVTINKADYDVMTCLISKAPKSPAFRIYFGIDPSGSIVKNILAINPDWHESDSLIYLNHVINNGLCPEVCDVESPISHGLSRY